MEWFLELYGNLPRGGPGSNELTRRAYRAMTNVLSAPRILDIGCGPGMQSIELLKISQGTLVAVDLLPEMIARVQVAAEAAGVSERLVTYQQDMHDLDFPPESFDVVWCEGAIYLMGFEAGLRKFLPFIKSGGHLAVSEAVWLQPNPPAEAVEFWKEYPEIDTIENKLSIIERVGFELIDHFVFPPSAWTEEYYTPLEQKIAEKAEEWEGIPEAEAVLAMARQELSVFQKCHEYYSYAFFVMRNSFAH